jgi:hypothetical protein
MTAPLQKDNITKSTDFDFFAILPVSKNISYVDNNPKSDNPAKLTSILAFPTLSQRA